MFTHLDKQRVLQTFQHMSISHRPKNTKVNTNEQSIIDANSPKQFNKSLLVNVLAAIKQCKNKKSHL